MIDVVLADDHAVLRAGLKLLLNARSDMRVIGEASDGIEVLTLAKTLQPDVVLLDLTMPRLGGIDVLPLLCQVAPNTRLLILTMHDDESYLRQALKRGASGYVLKKAADIELVLAIQAVMRGEIYVHPAMTKVLLEDIKHPPLTKEVNLWQTLSEREQDVMQMVAMGHTSREIADQLALSVKTVETYRMRGMEKLGLSSRAALVRFALAHGIMAGN